MFLFGLLGFNSHMHCKDQMLIFASFFGREIPQISLHLHALFHTLPVETDVCNWLS